MSSPATMDHFYQAIGEETYFFITFQKTSSFFLLIRLHRRLIKKGQGSYPRATEVIERQCGVTVQVIQNPPFFGRRFMEIFVGWRTVGGVLNNSR